MEIAMVVWAACGLIAAYIAGEKDRSLGGWFLIGVLFGPFGVLAAIVVGHGEPVPQGMRKVTCPRCSARQNIADFADQYECWQCKQFVRAPASKRSPTPLPTRPTGSGKQNWISKKPRK